MLVVFGCQFVKLVFGYTVKIVFSDKVSIIISYAQNYVINAMCNIWNRLRYFLYRLFCI